MVDLPSPGASGRTTRSTPTAQNTTSDRDQLDTIPVGTVQYIRGELEARIAAQNRENDSVLLERTHEHASAMHQRHQTYAGQLRVVEALGLCNLTSDLIEFLRAHDNMYRAITRTDHVSHRAEQSSTIDPLTYVAIRIHSLRNIFYYQRIISTFSSEHLKTMRKSGALESAIVKLKDILIKEYLQILAAWDDLTASLLEDHELENVGPDHDINDLGQDVKRPQVEDETAVEDSLCQPHMDNATKVKSMNSSSLPTPPSSPITLVDAIVMDAAMYSITMDPLDNEPAMDPWMNDPGMHPLMDETTDDEYDDEDDADRYCSICAEIYTDHHPAFCLTACGHTFGKACISQWVNSTARNANLCPQCRQPLCTRRPRRPKSTRPIEEVLGLLENRLVRTMHLFYKLAELHAFIWGMDTRRAFYDNCISDLNWGFFYEGIGWVFVFDEGMPNRWRLEQVNWHE